MPGAGHHLVVEIGVHPHVVEIEDLHAGENHSVAEYYLVEVGVHDEWHVERALC